MYLLQSSFQQLICFMLFSFCFFSCIPPQQNNAANSWTIVYKNDKQGKTVMGRKAQLINAVRQGLPIRIGWGNKGKTISIEHISEPIWVAIMNEQEVMVNLDPQVFSKINWEDYTATYADSTRLDTEWRVSLTTKGDFDAVWYNRATNKVIRRRPQNHSMTWFVKGYDPTSTAAPFFIE